MIGVHRCYEAINLLFVFPMVYFCFSLLLQESLYLVVAWNIMVADFSGVFCLSSVALENLS